MQESVKTWKRKAQCRDEDMHVRTSMRASTDSTGCSMCHCCRTHAPYKGPVESTEEVLRDLLEATLGSSLGSSSRAFIGAFFGGPVDPSVHPEGDSGVPSGVPSGAPSGAPTGVPSGVPLGAPSGVRYSEGFSGRSKATSLSKRQQRVQHLQHRGSHFSAG